jgi:hypothetical protein
MEASKTPAPGERFLLADLARLLGVEERELRRRLVLEGPVVLIGTVAVALATEVDRRIGSGGRLAPRS